MVENLYFKINNFLFYKLIEDKLIICDFRNNDVVFGTESSYYFLNVLSEEPQNVTSLIEKLKLIFTTEFDEEQVKNDLMEFYTALIQSGYISCGETADECNKNSVYFSYITKNTEPNDNISCLKEVDDATIFKSTPLQSVLIEITQKCNERCVQCYIPHSQKNVMMNDDDFYSLIDQIEQIGTVSSIRISGGECMTHPSFKNYIRYIKEKGFALSLLTNLTLLDDEIVEILSKGKLSWVQASLFSLDEKIQDGITQCNGSLKIVLNNLQKLKDADIPVAITCQCLNQNKDSLGDLIDYCKRNKFDFHLDYNIILRQDLSTDNLANTIQDSEFYSSVCETCIKCKSGYLENNLMKIQKPLRKPDSKVCSAGFGSCVVHTDLTVGPCPGWLINLGSLRNQKLMDIWLNSSLLNEIREIRLKNFRDCVDCPTRNICYICPSQIYNETGNPDFKNFKMPRRICDMYKTLFQTFCKNSGGRVGSCYIKKGSAAKIFHPANYPKNGNYIVVNSDYCGWYKFKNGEFTDYWFNFDSNCPKEVREDWCDLVAQYLHKNKHKYSQKSPFEISKKTVHDIIFNSQP